MADTFKVLGIEKGDRVILFIEKSIVYVVAHLAIQKKWCYFRTLKFRMLVYGLTTKKRLSIVR
jgi:hypothetical protein